MSHLWTADDRRRLARVHPDLVIVLTGALLRLPDWLGVKVIEGERSKSRQAALRAAGASQVSQGKHQLQPDGMVWAVDIGAVVAGRTSWHWPHYFELAYAVQAECLETGVELIWGGSWDRLTGVRDLEAAQRKYVSRSKRNRRQPLLDGPHYEVPNVRTPPKPGPAAPI